jgi:hypothetical protein
MNRFVTCLAIFGLLGVVACSGDSPSAPAVPTVVPQQWQFTNIVVDPQQPVVDTLALIEVTVVRNGSRAPDGTDVTFTASSGVVFTNGATEYATTTSAGKAVAGFTTDTAGLYTIEFAVADISRSQQVRFSERGAGGGSDALQIFQPLVPNVGTIFGVDDPAEQVLMRGKGIQAPVEVIFTLQSNGQQYPAIVERVVGSNPLSSEGEITIRTPYLSGLTATERNQTQRADVTVTRAIGAENEDTETLIGAFTFMPEDDGGGGPTPAEDDLEPLVLYVVNPDSGPKAGGNTVTIIGRNFRGVVYDDDLNVLERPEAVSSVQFGGRQADVLGISPDGLQLQVLVPRLQTLPLENPQAVDVTVTTAFAGETYTESLNQAYVYMPDEPTPRINSVTPIAGPINGGTVVTIYGSGFQVPVEVRFGDLAATEVEVVDDPTLADNDVITCVTPDYSQQNAEPPITVDVRVTNLETGKNNTLGGAFTYGQQLYITGNTPFEGRPGDLVAIYGAGFEQPLEVFFANNEKLDVVSVSGSEVLARFPSTMDVTCGERTGNFRVSLLESQNEATGGSFTLLGNNPTVVDVRTQDGDVFVGELGGESATIFGVNFTSDVLVEINNVSLVTSNVVPQSDTEIRILTLPSADDIGLTFQTESCITGGGQQGIRQAPTPVSVGVVNFPGQCGNTLQGALIYEPADTTCVVAPGLSIAPISFPPTEVPGPSAGQPISITNTGAGTLDISLLNLTGQFFFDAGCSQPNAGPLSIPPFGFNNSLSIYFCPNTDNGATYAGQLTITSNAPNSPTTINLSAQEAFPTLNVSTGAINFAGGGYPEDQTFDVLNTGTDDLDYNVTVSGASFSVVSGGSGTVTPAGSATVTIRATAAGTGSATVTGTNPDVTGSPKTVNLNAP